jgi:iron-sulfur cluster assembly protein
MPEELVTTCTGTQGDAPPPSPLSASTLNPSSLANHAMSVSLTEAAAEHVSKALAKRGKGKGLRLGVKTSGCSGLAYRIEYADDIHSTDITFTYFGVQVIVDAQSLPYLNGTQLDFVKEGLNQGLKFNNPNVQNECGCGESFSV